MLVKTTNKPLELPAAEIILAGGKICLVDPGDFEYLNQFKWFLKKSASKYYVVTTMRVLGKKIFVRMHRVVALTPPWLLCHHINGNSLDNRRANLQNMTEYDHVKCHSWR